jgi:hypothetical protein
MKRSKMNADVPLSKNIDNTEKKNNSKNQVIESVKKILRTSNQLSDDPTSIRTQPSIDIGGTSNGRGKGNNGIRLWQRTALSNATYAIDPVVEISLYHYLDMQSGGEILFINGFRHWKEWTPHQMPLGPYEIVSSMAHQFLILKN